MSSTYTDEPDFVECPKCAEHLIPKPLSEEQKDYSDGCLGYSCPNGHYSESYLPPADPITLLFKENIIKVAKRQKRKRQTREEKLRDRHDVSDTDLDN